MPELSVSYNRGPEKKTFVLPGMYNRMSAPSPRMLHACIRYTPVRVIMAARGFASRTLTCLLSNFRALNSPSATCSSSPSPFFRTLPILAGVGRTCHDQMTCHAFPNARAPQLRRPFTAAGKVDAGTCYFCSIVVSTRIVIQGVEFY